ncbi:MAG: tetratricopeptide repeat protein [Flavobacteriales bacterium]|nr:tetratricopeptide repeat protein [Flavobacteriales bacterium]
MVQRQVIYIVVLLAFTISLKAQEERSFIRQGNKYFSDSNFIMADSMYSKAVEINPNSIEAQYNIANSFYEQKNYEEAITGLENTIPQIDSNDQKAKAYHNLGNAYMETKKLEAAIEAYKNALRNNPTDTGARYNLAYAQSMMRKNDNNKDENNKDKDLDEKDKKENKNDKDGKNKDSKNNPEEQKKKQDEEKKDQDKKDDQPDNDGDKDKEGKKEKDNQKGDEKGEEKKGKEDDGKPGGEEGKESKEETDKKGQGAGEKDDNQPQKVKAISKAKANELLKELENDEKYIREKMIRMKMKQRPRKNIDKDW